MIAKTLFRSPSGIFGRLTDRGVSHHDVDQLVESGAGVPRKARCFWTSPTSTPPNLSDIIWLNVMI